LRFVREIKGEDLMKKISILLLLVSCCFSVFGQSKRAKKQPARKKIITTQTQKKEQTNVLALSNIPDEEYTVYMVILGKDAGMFVVTDRSSVNDFGGSGNDLKQNFDELNPETIEDFKSKNKESSRLEKKFPTKNTYVLISDEELKKFFDKGLNWEGFYKKYPKSGGFSAFSRVGFSADGKQALVFVAQSCGGLCGEGNYYFLKNENGEWKVIKKQMTWIS